jgi:hypothetical protein
MRRGKAAGRQAADELADGKGPHRYESTVKSGGPPFPPSWVEDTATIIGRGVEDDATSDQLDVDETLRLTLREGVRPVLAFEPPPRNSALLVLEDTSPAMAPWAAKVAFLLDGLVRQGIAVERWFFETDPSLVSREQFGRTVRLERLADTRGERALLVIATGEGLDEVLLQRKRLASTLKERWTRRSWLNPIANRRYWPAALRRAPMNVWPLTRDGLRGMAWELATAPIVAASARRAAEVRDVTADDVERIKRLIALVPHPTLALAEQLRRRYCPNVPDEVILFLAREGALHGERVLLSDEEVRRLLCAQRREAPNRERRVREYLIEVLDASTPPEGSVAHLRWQADRALQTINAAAAGGADAPAEAVESLAALADGPLADEVQSAVDLTDAPSPVRTRVEEASRRFAARARGLAPRWAAPGAAGMLAAALLAFASYRGAKPVANGRGEVVPHVLGAYQLSFGPATMPDKEHVGYVNLWLARKGVPKDVELYWGKRHITLRYEDLGLNVREEDTGEWWQARTPMQPYGNLALSNAVWVPKMHVVEGSSSPPRFVDPRHDILPAPLDLMGRTLNAETGLPVSNAEVSIEGVSQYTDEKGAFLFRLPSGVSSVRIQVKCLGFEPYTSSVPAESIPGGLLIKLQPVPLSSLTDAGQKRATLRINFDTPPGNGWFPGGLRALDEAPYQLSSQNGTFVKGRANIEVNVSPGNWTLTATFQAFKPLRMTIKIAPGKNNQNIILQPSQGDPLASAFMTIVGPPGVAPSDVSIIGAESNPADENAYQRWSGTSARIAPGLWRVRLRNDFYDETIEVRLDPGKVTEVKFHEPQYGVVEFPNTREMRTLVYAVALKTNPGSVSSEIPVRALPDGDLFLRERGGEYRLEYSGGAGQLVTITPGKRISVKLDPTKMRFPIFVTESMLYACMSRGRVCSGKEATLNGTLFDKGVVYTQSPDTNDGYKTSGGHSEVSFDIPAGARLIRFTVGDYYLGNDCDDPHKKGMIMSVQVDGITRWGPVQVSWRGTSSSGQVTLPKGASKITLIGNTGDGTVDCDDSVWVNVRFDE